MIAAYTYRRLRRGDGDAIFWCCYPIGFILVLALVLMLSDFSIEGQILTVLFVGDVCGVVLAGVVSMISLVLRGKSHS